MRVSCVLVLNSVNSTPHHNGYASLSHFQMRYRIPPTAALLAHAGGVLYGMELGSVTLKRIGVFCFPIKHSTHTRIQILGRWL